MMRDVYLNFFFRCCNEENNQKFRLTAAVLPSRYRTGQERGEKKMSFAAETKKELTKLEIKDCCAKAELAALIRMNGSISFSNRQIVLDIPTENAAIARRIYTLIKRVYSFHVELLVRKKMRLKKNNVYIVRLTREARTLLEDLNIIDETFTFNRGIADEIQKSVLPAIIHERSFSCGRFH